MSESDPSVALAPVEHCHLFQEERERIRERKVGESSQSSLRGWSRRRMINVVVEIGSLEVEKRGLFKGVDSSLLVFHPLLSFHP